MSGIHFVFTRCNESFISRAIQWFEWGRKDSARRCSHGIVKFWPEGPIFKSNPMAFEAMEKGCWMDFFEKSLGRQTVVAEFRLKITADQADKIMRETLEKFNDWNYDFTGVGLNGIKILLKRWFGSIWRWFGIVWKLEKGQRELFCTAVMFRVAKLCEHRIFPSRQWTHKVRSDRQAAPKPVINMCFDLPECYEWIRGEAKPNG